MPPRFAYWTILIDRQPTAFRARDREDLVPTFTQLRRTNPQIEMKWFARGRLWESPEQAQWAQRHGPQPRERRDRDWRPGGAHVDPRARFDKRKDGKPPRKKEHARTSSQSGPASGGGEYQRRDRGWRPGDARTDARARFDKPDMKHLSASPSKKSPGARPWKSRPPSKGGGFAGRNPGRSGQGRKPR